ILFFNPHRMMDMMTSSMSKDEDSKPITLNIMISAGLNKFKISRINAVSKTLGISKKDVKKDKIDQIVSRLTTELDEVIEKLPPESIEALKFVMDEGGWVKYNKLSNEYGEENDSYFWETEPPTSTVGVLRLHGLLFVGKTGIDGRMYKVAVVPKDIREVLGKILK
ncbi:MAG: hypothetical protein Q8N79_08270, partial [Candidatus Methanoperedens sp.]|nr:hypothetical protein [Candidatus Methanoperedens sp.]